MHSSWPQRQGSSGAAVLHESLQYGVVPGTMHWHWDDHPQGHCDPNYVVGDVVSPGWCGVILGNFMN